MKNENLKETPDQEPEAGAAHILIELEDSEIIVRHGSDKSVILFQKKARKGDWDKIWDAIKKI